MHREALATGQATEAAFLMGVDAAVAVADQAYFQAVSIRAERG
jgi:hypothetical protein